MTKKLIYNRFNPDPFHTHQKILQLVPANSSVLELGSGSGYFTQKLIAKGCQVTAIEKDVSVVQIAKNRNNNRVICGDLDNIVNLLSQKERFQIIIAADVLEHLVNPANTLQNLNQFLSKEGQLIISVPNVANFSIRLNLLLGHFDYQEYGILDQTHLYFFTKVSIEKMIKKAGFSISFFDVVAGFETAKLYRKTVGKVVFRIKPLRYLEYYLSKLFPELFALEFIYVLKKRP